MFFGSEHGDIEAFLNTAAHTIEHEDRLNEEARKQIAFGLSYPQAMAKAFRSVTREGGNIVDLSKPNNILGFHYVKAIMQKQLSMKPETVKRRSSGYHDSTFPEADRIASATSIRKSIFETGSLADSRFYLPKTTVDELDEYARTFGMWHSPEDYFPFEIQPAYNGYRRAERDIRSGRRP